MTTDLHRTHSPRPISPLPPKSQNRINFSKPVNKFDDFQITWIDGLGNVVTKRSPNVYIDYSTEQIPESRLFTAKSILTLKPKKEHHNTTFICQAQNTADRTYQSAKIRLFVKYAPKVSVNDILESVYLSSNFESLNFGRKTRLCGRKCAKPCSGFR